ncbi:transposase [Methyloprofundus sedimenti]|uniref:Transposase n=1 Tax=Methyloprofundus sedimenti TaxID=1420851 RepID=A0A1V8MAT0_9GAMM|nr:transposase [Methyloprofundus sedimenti]OQK18636.1 transposase [Methyloprofundus sedimenti]OQK18699.1 transposase [Methyloprofundus sedimenti]OQK18702.1 transposase [Methyloprofundus sedimenti]
MGFLLSEPKQASCCRLGEVMSISHDSVNRFLNRESYTGRDLYNEASPTLNLKGGTLSVDDSVLDKPHSQYMAFVSHFWSGKHHRAVKGINLVTLYYTDTQGKHQPVNFRVVDKAEGKTKNDYFLDMLAEVLSWGLEPGFVTGDSWYSCVKNLKRIRNHQIGLLFALESNRLVSVEEGTWVQVKQLEVPEEGLVVWLKNFGYVKLFRTKLKDQLRHYISALPNDEQTKSFGSRDFTEQHDRHWQIEQYHRAIKQVCNIERFQVRSKGAIKNHLFAAICGFVQLQKLSFAEVISNCYSVQRNLFKDIMASFIETFMPNISHLNPEFQPVVNA